MPGVRDGYCRIERFPGVKDTEISVITPVHPVDMISHIPAIAELAQDNGAIDTSKAPGAYRTIIEGEYNRLGIGGVRKADDEIQYDTLWEAWDGRADEWAVKNLSPDLYRKWRKDIFGQEVKLRSSQR